MESLGIVTLDVFNHMFRVARFWVKLDVSVCGFCEKTVLDKVC